MSGARYSLSPGPGSTSSSPHLSLSIPWCSRTLRWTVLASSLTPPSPASPQPGLPIDFIFDDDRFHPLLPGCLPDATRLTLTTTLLQTSTSTAVRHATPPNPCHDDVVLRGVVRVLLQAYLEFQRGQLSAASAGSTRLQFELSTLPPTAGLQLMYLAARDGEPAKACIGIPLDSLDTSGLLAAGADSNRPEGRQEPFRLNTTFKLTDLNLDPELQLQAPPWGVSCLVGVTLPSWTSQMCLMEYVPLLVDKVQAAVSAAALAAGAKHAFFEALHQALGQPLEYNRPGACAMYQLQYEQALLLLHVDASAGRFPDDKPLLSVSNVRLLGAGPDGSKVYRDYPWSPRWSFGEMAARVFNFLRAELGLFVRTRNPVLAGAMQQPAPGQLLGSPGG